MITSVDESFVGQKDEILKDQIHNRTHNSHLAVALDEIFMQINTQHKHMKLRGQFFENDVPTCF